jgi:hypothetical protein
MRIIPSVVRSHTSLNLKNKIERSHELAVQEVFRSPWENQNTCMRKSQSPITEVSFDLSKHELSQRHIPSSYSWQFGLGRDLLNTPTSALCLWTGRIILSFTLLYSSKYAWWNIACILHVRSSLFVPLLSEAIDTPYLISFLALNIYWSSWFSD